MLIRFGCEISVTCAEPTSAVCLLSVNDDRKNDICVIGRV